MSTETVPLKPCCGGEVLLGEECGCAALEAEITAALADPINLGPLKLDADLLKVLAAIGEGTVYRSCSGFVRRQGDRHGAPPITDLVRRLARAGYTRLGGGDVYERTSAGEKAYTDATAEAAAS